MGPDGKLMWVLGVVVAGKGGCNSGDGRYGVKGRQGRRRGWRVGLSAGEAGGLFEGGQTVE